MKYRHKILLGRKMSLELELIFDPAVQTVLGEYETPPEVITLPEITPNMHRILLHIVYPYAPYRMEFQDNTITLSLRLDTLEEAESLIEEADYYQGIAQDTWMEGDIELTSSDLDLLGYPSQSQVLFVPLLRDSAIYNLV